MILSRANGNRITTVRYARFAPMIVASTVACFMSLDFIALGRRCLADDKPVIETIDNSIGMKLAKIPAGKFKMGSPDSEEGRKLGELQREIAIDKPFYMGAHEVTQEQYEKVMGENPSVEQGEKLPVGGVSWYKAAEFCDKLGEKEHQTYRLPTEAEWEYACRAGTTTVFHYGDKLSYEDANINAAYPYGSDVRGPTALKAKPVGSYKPNAFGLFDMHGNVWEFCLDTIRGRPDLHVLRGGGADGSAAYCRSAMRWSHNDGWQWTGLRVVRSVEREPGEFNIPVARELDQADRFSSQEMIAKFDAALTKPAVDLLAPVVIFPVVDADRRVRADGAALSAIASFAAAYGPERRMEICLQSVLHRLMNGGCLKAGSTLDDESIRICLASIGTETYVLPRLIEKDGKLELTETVQKLGGEPGKTISHTLEPDKISGVPELIARGVLEHAGAKLSDAQAKQLSTLTVRKPEDFVLLSTMCATLKFGDDNQNLQKFLQRNPRCLPAWHLFVFESNPAEKAVARYKNASKMLGCEQLQLDAIVREKASQDALIAALELAPKFRHDTHYYFTLASIAGKLGDAELANHIVKAWRESDAGYSGCASRGEFFKEWGWDARGGGFAGEVTKEGWKLFHERLGEAKQELERGLELNPLGWEAHARLISVGLVQNVPREYVDQHFEKAIKLRPRYREAYESMFQTLQPRWGGEPANLLAFARTCIKSDFWDEGIPELGRQAFEEVNFDVGEHAYKRSGFADSDVWDAILLYAESAQRSAPPEYKKFATNVFAKYGGLGKHNEEVAETFRRLEKEGHDKNVFWDGFTYNFLRDQVFAEAETGQTQVRAALRAALDVGEFDKAQEWLDKLDAAAKENATLRDRCRRAIEIGREVQSGKTVELSAEQMHGFFDGIDDRWKVEGDELVCRLPAGANAVLLCPFGMGRVEFSGKLSWLDVPEVAELHTHTRTVRDDVTLQFLPQQNRVYRRRNRMDEGWQPFKSDAATFRIARGEENDRILLPSGENWEPGVVEEPPSGFGFQLVAAKDHPAVVKLGSVQIKPAEAE